MIEIIKTSEDLNIEQRYKLTVSPEIQSMKDIDDGACLEIRAWCHYTDTKENGESVELLSILTVGGDSYATQSKTFYRSFMDIWNLGVKAPFTIKKVSGTTKAGRPFVNCVLDFSFDKGGE